MSEPTKAPRVRRTPAERAQAELDKANTRAEKAREHRDQLVAALDAANRELQKAVAYQTFVGQHPDLPKSDG